MQKLRQQFILLHSLLFLLILWFTFLHLTKNKIPPFLFSLSTPSFFPITSTCSQPSFTTLPISFISADDQKSKYSGNWKNPNNQKNSILLLLPKRSRLRPGWLQSIKSLTLTLEMKLLFTLSSTLSLLFLLHYQLNHTTSFSALLKV